jgi:DNA-binding MarR family transcriptional regulator
VHDAYVHAFTDSLNVVFLVAAGIGVVAFVVTWFIKELPLRDTVTTAGVGEAFAVPKDTDPFAELARELSILTRREQAARILERLAARAGVDLTPTETWLLARYHRDPSLDLGELAETYELDAALLEAALARLVADGLVSEPTGSPPHISRPLTPAGDETFGRLTRCGQERLTELLAGWQPDLHPELRSLIEALAAQFLATSPATAAA